MPLYTYRHRKTGQIKQMMKTIAERDAVHDYERVPEFPVARLGLAENPYSQEYGVRQGLKDLEEKHGLAAVQKQLGQDLDIETVKQTWRN